LSIVVFGSINMDLVARVPRLPAPGETLTGHGFFTAPGGKGANQAVACARLGAATRMIGRVGDDAFGTMLRESLAGYGVETSGVAIQPGVPSGVAVITVDDAAENEIIVVPGANGIVGREDLARLAAALDGARVLLLQLEVPMDAVVAAAELGRRRGVTVILDPAPAQSLPEALYAAVDILTPNESEAAVLVGFPLDDPDAIARASQTLLTRGAQCDREAGRQGRLLEHWPGERPFPDFPRGSGRFGGRGRCLQRRPGGGSERWPRHGRGDPLGISRRGAVGDEERCATVNAGPRGGGNTPDLSRPAPLPAAQRQLPLMPELKATLPRLTTIRSNEVDSRRAILEWRER
jgi:ribokinase